MKKQMEAERMEWVEATLREMSLEERVGQLLMPDTSGVLVHEESEQFGQFLRAIEKLGVGGFIIYNGDALTTAALTNRLQARARVPLLFASDFEGGVGMQLRGGTRLPRAMALAATGDTESAAEAARITAREGRAIGVHINFYPVLDVNNNPANPIINTRAFSDDPEVVANWGAAFIRAAQDAGQLATAKHFPGHGDTSLDSHILMPTLDATRERMERIELPPFRAAVQRGVRAVMTAHIAVPALDDGAEEKRPATLSPSIVDGLLRRRFGFEGLIFSDALNMGAVADRYEPGEAAVRAVEAGCDVLLYMPDVARAHAALCDAVARGRITRERVDQSTRRVLEAKAWCGLNEERMVSLDNVWDVVASPAHTSTARSLFERAVTLVRDPLELLPVAEKGKRVATVILKDAVPVWAHALREPAGSRFSKEVQARWRGKRVELSADAADIGQVLEEVRDCDVVMAAVCARVAAYKGSVALGEAHAEILRALDQANIPTIAAVFGNPYVLPHMPERATTLLTFESAVESEASAVRVIAGEVPARGRSPVALPVNQL
ncbi:MAG TPA: glycoside hydrolase family 3 N-terminal domain-containing protein [Pyrinomonadaceae bacterium]|nr:glycoside hydrolase family 3 N-terminal domain-containing protein [Pyrinomonadaceae bacterium]